MTTVIIPALNEGENIEKIVRFALGSTGVAEVIVVDDGSTDDTRARAQRGGARVIGSTLRGKGASMADGLAVSAGDVIVYLDGDLRGLDSKTIEVLVAPIHEDRADMVKARFSRSGGRVTTLTAKPMLHFFFPELAHFAQPLGGVVAARRQLLERVTFETDYGVDLSLLIDAHFAGARIAEVDIGHLEHDTQTLEALGQMAKQVTRTLLAKADAHGRLSGRQMEAVAEQDRISHAEDTLEGARTAASEKLAIFDMDGTLLADRSILVLAEQAGRLGLVEQFLDNPAMEREERTSRIAECLAGIPHHDFVHAARIIPLNKGAAETVISLRRRGYRVGIVSDSFHTITEIMRRRVFADFSVGNILRFRDGRATGESAIAPSFLHVRGCRKHRVCKLNVLRHLEEKFGVRPAQILAVGDGSNDTCMLGAAGTGIAFEPKSNDVRDAADRVIHGDLRRILEAGKNGHFETSRRGHAVIGAMRTEPSLFMTTTAR